MVGGTKRRRRIGREASAAVGVAGVPGLPEGVTAERFSPVGRVRASALLFHASNGSRIDLTQLAVALAEQGLSCTNVTWHTPGVVAFPTAYQQIEALLQLYLTRVDVVVVWADSAMVVLRCLVEPPVAQQAERLRSVVTVAGFFGWQSGSPPFVADSARCARFFGGSSTSISWNAKTVWGELSRWPSTLPILGVCGAATRSHNEEFFADAQQRGARVRLLHSHCADPELISPRHPAGQATVGVIVSAATSA